MMAKLGWFGGAAAVIFLSVSLAAAQQVPQQAPQLPTTTRPAATPQQDAAGKAAPAGKAAAQQPITDTIAVPTNPLKDVILKAGKAAIEATFGFGQIDDIPADLTAGVTAKGFARQVSAEGQNVDQVLINAVSKGDKTEPIGQGLTAQIDVPAGGTGDVPAGATVTTKGSKAVLLAALKKLAEQDKDKKDSSSQQQNTEEEKNYGAGGGAPSNPLAAQWQPPTTPTGTSAPAATSAAQTTTAQVTTQGCGMRIDLSQMRVFQQNKTQMLTGGTVTQDGTCADSNVSFPIQRDYTTCPDQVDMTAMQAYPQYKNYYVDSNGTTDYIDQSCQPDPSKYYAITQDYDACSMSVDLTGGNVYRQAELVYTNGNNAQVVVQACQRTQDAPIPLTKSTAACPARIDMTAMLAHEQSQATYQWNGVVNVAQSCTDDGVTFPITANQSVCSALVDQASGMAFPQQRYQYVDATGMTQWADSGCSPITSQGAKLQSTTDGCTAAANYIPHLTAGYTDGSTRTYYTAFDGSGSRVYVTACQEDVTVQYPNQTEIVGWQNNDTTLSAQPVTDIYINAPGGKVVVSSAAVAAGAPTVPYTLAGQADVPNGQSSYTGCNAYRLTTTTDTWTRPDGTTYAQALGNGTPQGPVNVCASSVVDSRYLQSGTYCTQVAQVDTVGIIYATVNKTQIKNMENGSVISTSCAFASGWDVVHTPTFSNGLSDEGTGACDSLGWGDVQTLFVSPCPF